MSSPARKTAAQLASARGFAKIRKQYENGALRFSDREDFDGYDHHLAFDHTVAAQEGNQREQCPLD
jgi:hypothetical protein